MNYSLCSVQQKVSSNASMFYASENAVGWLVMNGRKEFSKSFSYWTCKARSKVNFLAFAAHNTHLKVTIFDFRRPLPGIENMTVNFPKGIQRRCFASLYRVLEFLFALMNIKFIYIEHTHKTLHISPIVYCLSIYIYYIHCIHHLPSMFA